jgi:hypothetical protein
MLATFEAVSNLVLSSKRALGSDSQSFLKLQEAQYVHLKGLVQSQRLGAAEAAAAMDSLNNNSRVTAAFTKEHLTGLADALAQQMSGATQVAALQPNHHKQPQQTNYNLHKYMTKDDYEFMCKTCTDFEKIGKLVEICHRIGLIYPTELTVVAIIAVLKLSSQTALSPDDTHKLVVEFKRLNKARRHVHMYTVQHFPSDPADFIKSFPSAFGSDRVHDTPFSDLDVEMARSAIAARKTHRSLAAPTHMSSSAAGTRQQQQQQQGDLPFGLLANALMMHFGARRGRSDDKDIPIDYLNPRFEDSPSEPRSPTSIVPSPATKYQGHIQQKHSLPALPLALGPAPPAIALAREADPSASASSGPASVQIATGAPGLGQSSSFNEAIDEVALALQKKKGKPSKEAHKRPAAAGPEQRMTISVVASRRTVTARTGLSGKGTTKSFGYDTDPAEAKASAEAWLRSQCAQLGIDYTA